MELAAAVWLSVIVEFSITVAPMLTKPSLFLPSLIFPLFFFAAFAGGLSAVGNAPNFDYPNYTTFQYVFVLMQSAVFGGVFTGFAIAADFEFGFARRMLLATRNRSSLIAGYVLTALARALLVWAVVTVVAIATGAEISGSAGDLIEVLVIAILLNFAATLFASGLAMRFRTLQAAPLIQLPAFLVIMPPPSPCRRGPPHARHRETRPPRRSRPRRPRRRRASLPEAP